MGKAPAWYADAIEAAVQGDLVDGARDPATGQQNVDCPRCLATHQHPDRGWHAPDCGGPRYFVNPLITYPETETKEN